MHSFTKLLTILPLLWSINAETSLPNTGDQEPSFLFAFGNDVIVLPKIDACPARIPISPATPLGLGAIDAIGPYVMTFMVNEQLMNANGTSATQLYTKTVLLDQMTIAQSIPNPLQNGTQFIACMWGSGGKSGGCHDLHTVVSTPEYANAYANNSSTCRSPEVLGSWVTPPNKRLDVEVAGINGIVADPRSWPASCSDLQFTPKNGTPPYTLVIAPAYHPPVNITGNSTAPLNYTIRMTHGQAFFASMYDKAGSSWAMGPFHAGTNKNVSCLQVLTGQSYVGGSMPGAAGSSSGGGVGVAALGGGIAGAFVAGAVLAGLAVFLLARKKKSNVRRNNSTESLDGYTNPRPATWRSNTHASMAKIDPAVSPYTDLNSPSSEPNTLSYTQSHSPHSPSQLHAGSLSALNANAEGQDRAYRNVMGLGDFHPQQSFGQGGSSAGAPSESGMANPHSSNYNLAGSSSQAGAGPSSPRKSVYVVHSDGGNNVHITLPEGGADVVELPPNYNPGVHSAGGSSSAAAAAAAAAPEKSARPNSG